MSQSLFSQPLNVINVGIAMFSDDLKKQHVEVTQLDWTPPGQGNMQVVQALDNIADSPLADKIAAANQQALERIIQSHPVLIGFDQAINVVPGMTAKTILHAGPPVTWEKMCGAMKGAVTGALVFEGLAKDLDEAAELAASGEITFSPCHEHDCVGSMAGVTSASMFMHIVKNKTYGNIAYTNMSEQMAKILRMGANDQSVIDRLNWMRDVQGPMLRDAMKIIGETIPLLGFMGVPSAIDITRVGSSGILPVINTAIAHKDAGVGMIGAGIVHPPFACFEKAILGWCERYGV
ncbi:DUF1116 domain-containing protein [Escherichia coli]